MWKGIRPGQPFWPHNLIKVKRSKLTLITVMVIFGGIGVASLLASKAAVPSTSIEPEVSTQSGTAESRLDGSASQGKYVMFGARICADEQYHVQYSSVPSERAGINKPAGASASSPAPIAILVHGGGWILGARNDLCAEKNELTTKGFVTINADYQLATETRSGWPVEHNGIKRLVAWVQANATTYGGDPNHIVMYGPSAGAHLSYLTSLQLNQANPGTIKAVAGVSGPTDLTAMLTDNAHEVIVTATILYIGCPNRDYSQCSSSTLRAASPVFNINTNCPKMYIAGAADEWFVPIAQSHRLETNLRSAGCTVKTNYYPGVQHADWSQISPDVVDWLWANK